MATIIINNSFTKIGRSQSVHWEGTNNYWMDLYAALDSQDINNCSSTIHFRVISRAPGSYTFGTSGNVIKNIIFDADGVGKDLNTKMTGYNGSYKNNTRVFDTTIKLNHNLSTGQLILNNVYSIIKFVTPNVIFNSAKTSNSGSGKVSIAVPDIPTSSKIISASNINEITYGQSAAVTFDIDKRNPNATSNIKAYVNGQTSAFWSSEDVSNGSQSISIPSANLYDLHYTNNDIQNVQVDYVISTYINGDLIGVNNTYTAYLNFNQSSFYPTITSGPSYTLSGLGSDKNCILNGITNITLNWNQDTKSTQGFINSNIQLGNKYDSNGITNTRTFNGVYGTNALSIYYGITMNDRFGSGVKNGYLSIPSIDYTYPVAEIIDSIQYSNGTLSVKARWNLYTGNIGSTPQNALYTLTVNGATSGNISSYTTSNKEAAWYNFAVSNVNSSYTITAEIKDVLNQTSNATRQSDGMKPIFSWNSSGLVVRSRLYFVNGNQTGWLYMNNTGSLIYNNGSSEHQL